MRTLKETLVATIASAELLPACPQLSARPQLSAPAATVAPAPFNAAAAAPLWAGAAAKRRGVDSDAPTSTAYGKRVIGGYATTSNQQRQLHLMSRRDPRTWRPPV